MFEEERPAFVRVALQAGLVFEASQSFPRRRFMGIVTGSTLEYSLLEPVSLIQLKLRIDIFVTGKAAFCGACIQESGFWISMNGMARCAVHGCFSVRAGEKPGIILSVACDTFLRFFISQIFSFKSKDIGSAAFIHMRFSVAVAAGAALHWGMRVGSEGCGHIFMTRCAGFDVSVLIGGWFGGGQECRSKQDQTDKTNCLEKR